MRYRPLSMLLPHLILAILGACGDGASTARLGTSAALVTYPAEKCSEAKWLEFMSRAEYEPPSDRPLSTVVDLAVGAKGQVLVIEGQRPHAYLFSPSGRLERVIAGPGPGPAELSLPRAAQIVGDSVILIASNAPARLQEFSLDGDFRKSTRLKVGTFASDVINVVPDWELTKAGTVWVGLRQYDHNTVRGDSIPYAVAVTTEDGHVLAPVVEAELPGASPEGAVLFWQPKWTWTASDSLLVASPGDTARLSQFDTAGILIRAIESQDEIISVDDGMRESLRNGYLHLMEMRGEDATTLGQARERLGIPPQFPRVMRLIMADSGHEFWVQTIAADWNRRWPPDWIYEVYSADGNLLACADMPPRFRPMVVTSRRVWGVATDDLGIPHVQAYSFELPSVEEAGSALRHAN